MSYLSDIDLAIQTQQFWRSNPMMLDGTSMTRTNADYYFPKEGAIFTPTNSPNLTVMFFSQFILK